MPWVFRSSFVRFESIKKLLHFVSEARKTGGSIIGPHKSDIIATINKDFEASQLSTGQQKTLVLMILLAQCDYHESYVWRSEEFLNSIEYQVNKFGKLSEKQVKAATGFQSIAHSIFLENLQNKGDRPF